MRKENDSIIKGRHIAGLAGGVQGPGGTPGWHGGGERWRGECACGGGSVPRLVSKEEHAVGALLSRFQARAVVRSLACSLLASASLSSPSLSLSRLHWEIFFFFFGFAMLKSSCL